MSFTIGKVGRDVSSAQVVLDATRITSANGLVYEIEGALHSEDVLDAGAREAYAVGVREQLLGYTTNLDEAFVSISWDEDPSFDGFYTLDIPELTFEEWSLSRGIYPFNIQVTRLPDYAYGTIEEIIRGTVRLNDFGYDDTNTVPWLAVPSSRTQYRHGNFGHNQFVRATETGDVTFASNIVTHNYIATYSIRAANYLDGACSIEVNYSPIGCVISETGGANAPLALVGLRPPADPMGWRLYNGLLSIEPTTTVDGVALQVSFYDGEVWQGPHNFVIEGPGGFIQTFDYMGVIHNSPSLSVIRLGCRPNSVDTNVGRILLDLQLRRGSRFLQGFIQSDGVFGWGVEHHPGQSSSTFSAPANGVQMNSYVDGVRCALFTSKLFGTSNNLDIIANVDNTRWDFGIGGEFVSSSSFDLNTSVRQQYIAGSTSRVIYSTQGIA